jgi:hypothetical protein
MSYSEMVGSCRNKRTRKGFSIVWLALVWVIWKIRNERAFNNIVGPVVAKALDQIQRLSWLWYLSKMANDSCLLYIWMGLEPERVYGEGMKICPGHLIPSRCFVSSCYFIVVSRCVFLVCWLISFCALFFMFGTVFSLLLGVFVRALGILVKVYLFLFVVYYGHIVHLVLYMMCF